MSKSVLSKYEDEIYFKVQLKIVMRDRILAGIPRNESVLDYFMSARHMSEQEQEDFLLRVKSGALTDEEKDEVKNTAWCVFEKDREGQLCMWHGNVKAMMREIFVTLGLTQRVPIKRSVKTSTEGAAGGRQTLQHAIHVDPIRIPLEKDGKPITAPSGAMDKVKHIKDMNGVRSALGRHDYVDNAELTFILKWPASSVFDEEDMKKAFAVCQDDGLGACRSQGNGKFDVVEWKVLNAPKKIKKAQAVIEEDGNVSESE